MYNTNFSWKLKIYFDFYYIFSIYSELFFVKKCGRECLSKNPCFDSRF